MGIFDFFKQKDVGFDAGTENVRLFRDGKISLDERSEICVDIKTNTVSAIGNDIFSSENTRIISPVNYVIEDFHAFEHLLRRLIKKSAENGLFQAPRNLYISIPASATEVDKRAYRDSAEHAGAKNVYLIPVPFAAALGGDILQENDFILVDFGASKVEITLFIDGKPQNHELIRPACRDLSKSLLWFLKMENQIDLSISEASDFVRSFPKMDEAAKFFGGTEPANLEEIKQFLAEEMLYLEKKMRFNMEILLHPYQGTPLYDKIVKTGLYFTGGGSLISDLPERTAQAVGLPFRLSTKPLHDAILGIGKIMDDPDRFEEYLTV